MKINSLSLVGERVLPRRKEVAAGPSLKQGVRAVASSWRRFLGLRVGLRAGVAEGATGPAEGLEKPDGGIGSPPKEPRPQDTRFQACDNGDRTILGLIPDIIFRVNSAYEFLDIISPSNDKLYVSREEALGKRIGEVFPEEEARLFSNGIRNALETGILETIDYPLEVEAGRLHFEARIIPSDDREVVVLARDVTQERQARLARQKIEKTEGLSILAGGVAHDFNNLLTVILGHANLGMMETRKDSGLYSHLEAIESASLEAAGVCRKMLAYAGRNHVELHKINLNAVVGHMHQLLRRSVAQDIALKVELADNVPPVKSEASLVEQMVVSLVINAAEALGNKCGEIRIATGKVRISKTALKNMAFPSELSIGEAAFVEVSDNGVGMSPDCRNRMFEPFFTTKFTGRGLGLSEVHGIVTMHKGGCRVVSEKGLGTTVRLLLPALAEPECVAAVKHFDSPRNRIREGSILVVDDEKGMRRIAKSMLEASGISVVTAGSGGEAIEKFRRHQAAISAVLLDMAMPDRDGNNVLRELRKINSGVPVLMMSGYPDPGAPGPGEEEANGFLKKPFSLEELSAGLGRLYADQEPTIAET